MLYTAVHVKDKAYLILSFNIKLGKKTILTPSGNKETVRQTDVEEREKISERSGTASVSSAATSLFSFFSAFLGGSLGARRRSLRGRERDGS